MLSGAMNWPCLMFTTAPVFAAATTSSDCMQRYAGIWMHVDDFGRRRRLIRVVDVGEDRQLELALHLLEQLEPFVEARSLVEVERAAVVLRERRLEDHRDAEVRRDLLQALRRAHHQRLRLDDARARRSGTADRSRNRCRRRERASWSWRTRGGAHSVESRSPWAIAAFCGQQAEAASAADLRAELAQQLVVASSRALTRAHDALRAQRRARAAASVGDELADAPAKLARVAHQPTRVRGEQILDGLLEAEVVRAEQHRHRHDRGLHQVVPALVRAAKEQATADERDVGRGVELPSSPTVSTISTPARPGRARPAAIERRLAHGALAARRRVLLDGRRVGRIARHDDERGAFVRRARRARTRRAALRPRCSWRLPPMITTSSSA